MSKCDLRIDFDRTDRRFRGGEEVTGTVTVQVNEDADCNGIILEHFWQTHGRGNSATGPKLATELYRGPLRAGQSLKYPFQVTAPIGPPTYHGTYLNVDHYLMVRVRIPWAIDPRAKEEYVLLPSGAEYGNLRVTSPTGLINKQTLTGLGVPAGVAMILAGVFFFPCGLVLVPFGLLVLLFGVRKKLAEKKIGKVALSLGSLRVAPGGQLPLRLMFTPRHTSRLNGITAKLVGSEKCVSGSGTNKTTHTHKFFERTVVLVPECEVTAGRPIRVAGIVPIPETNAYSFHATDNDVLWELEVRVDIPMWPDWTDKRTVVVRPAIGAEAVEVTVVEEPPVPAARSSEPSIPPFAAPLDRYEPVTKGAPEPAPPTDVASTEAAASIGAAPVPEEVSEPLQDQPTEPPPPPTQEPAEPEAPVEEAPPAPQALPTDPGLVEIVGRIVSADRYSRDREQIIEENSETAFDCEIEVARSERTYSYIPDERFRKGRTVTGKLHGTDCEVSVQLVEARNGEIDGLDPGSLLHAKCRPLKWNTIYDRLEMREG